MILISGKFLNNFPTQFPLSSGQARESLVYIPTLEPWNMAPTALVMSMFSPGRSKAETETNVSNYVFKCFQSQFLCSDVCFSLSPTWLTPGSASADSVLSSVGSCTSRLTPGCRTSRLTPGCRSLPLYQKRTQRGYPKVLRNEGTTSCESVQSYGHRGSKLQGTGEN